MAWTLAVLDTSALYAAVDASEMDHRACVDVLSQPDLHFVIPALVATEVCQLIERRRGAAAEAAFLRRLEEHDLLAPGVEDWERMADLVRQYADFPLGAVDASVVALAERVETDLVITLDRRHFAAVQNRNGARFRLLPD